jgi:hypothetical protein
LNCCPCQHCCRRIQLIVDCCLCPCHIAATATALHRHAASRHRSADALPPLPPTLPPLPPLRCRQAAATAVAYVLGVIVVAFSIAVAAAAFS